MGNGMLLAAGAVAGAAAQYFLDPQQGRHRRNIARDRGLALARRQARDAASSADYAAGKTKGAASAAMPSPSDEQKLEQLGDAALARKVESEIFRAADAPKGQVDVNVEDGVVSLRGEVEQQWIERLATETEQVVGVKAVRNLLHVPGTPAPTSQARGS
jgi:osmotically-inducible protein OsmY